MNKFLRQLAVFLALISAASSALAEGEVKLLSARSTECASGSIDCPSANMMVFIEVKNIAYAKQVGVRHKNSAGSWVSTPAQYFMPTTNGKELWYVSLSGPSESFALYYTVNGVTYWDNNSGKNYKAARYTEDALLGSTAINDVAGYWADIPGVGPRLSGNVLVRQLGVGAREIKAVYTDDNWVTTKTAYASYQSTLPSGIEVWSFSLPTVAAVDTSKVGIAFKYTWSGGSAWDNSFGRNYGLHSQYFIARN